MGYRLAIYKTKIVFYGTKLYNYDLNNYARYIKYEKDYFINQSEIKELLDNAKDYDYYVIDWG